MSKGTIGSVLGAGIGFLVGGPAGARIGWMVGGMVGSSFDVIPGRKVGEMASPRAQEGEPIPLVFGSARVTGRLMSTGKPVIRKEKEGGKGGPKVENETAYLSYSILICESSELRDSSIGGILMVIENNEIVYDVRPNPAISAADSAKWAKNKKFYFGEETQGTDPTEEMIHGAGNVPAYRGLCRMVVTDEDVTQHGGSVPTYEFVTSQCGVVEAQVDGGSLLVTGSGIIPWSEASPPTAFSAITSAGSDIPAGVGGYYEGVWLVCGVNEARYSLDDRQTWIDVPFNSSDKAIASVCGGPDGWIITPTNAGYGLAWTAPLIPTAFTALSVVGMDTYRYPRYAGGFYFLASTNYLYRSPDLNPANFVEVLAVTSPMGAALDVEWFDSQFWITSAIYPPGNPNKWTLRRTTDFTSLTTVKESETLQMHQLQAGGDVLLVHCSSGEVLTSEDNFAAATTPAGLTYVNDGAHLDGYFPGRNIAFTGTVFYIIDDENSGVTTADGKAFSTAFDLAVIDAKSIAAKPAAEFAGIEIPDVPGHYINPINGEISGPVTVSGECAPITLQEVIDKLDARAGIPPANSVTTELADIEVPGYAIDTFVTVAEAKEPLRQIYFFDCPEWDDAIRYRLRGQPTDFTIDPDDLIEGEDATESATRGQTVEYPKRLHVQYIDPATGFKPMKQTAERISPDIRVKGEVVAGANITLDADTAKRAADIGLKSAWTEREDSREFATPIDYWPQAIAAHTFNLEGRRFRITELRLEAGAIYIKAVYDRISAYSSNAVGVVGPAPEGGSTIRGPTVSALMNLPVLRDADDRAGIYWAASGLLPTWKGAQLQLNRGSWENGPQVAASATMGTLTAALPSASRYGMDDANVLAVNLTPTSGALDSVTYDDLIAEKNAAAILYADGTAEIVQFQVAVETAPREYELTGLLRGRQDTAVGSHAKGAQFVLLDDAVRFVGLRPDDLGKALTFRAVSLGTDADAAATQTLTLTTIESLREWQPYNVTVTDDGSGGYCVEWIGRARLGSSQMPVHSINFRDYAVTFTEGANTLTAATADQSLCQTQAQLEAAFGVGFSAPTVAVVAKSRIHTSFDSAAGTPV